MPGWADKVRDLPQIIGREPSEFIREALERAVAEIKGLRNGSPRTKIVDIGASGSPGERQQFIGVVTQHRAVQIVTPRDDVQSDRSGQKPANFLVGLLQLLRNDRVVNARRRGPCGHVQARRGQFRREEIKVLPLLC